MFYTLYSSWEREMTITNIFFDSATSKTGHGATFLSHKIVPEGWATMEHDEYLLHWANFVPGAMVQNRSESILSYCSGNKCHAPLSVFCCIAEKKSSWATACNGACARKKNCSGPLATMKTVLNTSLMVESL